MPRNAEPNLSIVAEIARGCEWQVIDAEKARRAPRGSRMRCSECHGQVVTIGRYGPHPGFYFQHRKPHDGCRHLPARYKGTPSRHPQALT